MRTVWTMPSTNWRTSCTPACGPVPASRWSAASLTDAHSYWQGVRPSLADGGRVLLVARRDGRAVGTTQIVLATPPNGGHRAEICKVLVHPAARRAGLGRALMLAAEEVADGYGKSLLVLDTVRRSAGERLYRAIGYQVVGVIPGYAYSTQGVLEGTRVMFKVLPPISG